MKLVLMNSYPYPLPDDFDSDTHEARAFSLELRGVIHFEWCHTVTVEFSKLEAYFTAQELTGWGEWSPGVLEATTSADDGYDHPAIIAGDMAYCGFVLLEDDEDEPL